MITIDDLGGYATSSPGLTLHDLGELLRRLGRAAGFEVQSEYKCEDERDLAIDWVWLDGSRVVAAFEIEGRDVGHGSVSNDVEKLACSRLIAHECRVRVIALFQVNHNLRPKNDVGDPKRRVARWSVLSDGRVQVMLDVELLEPETMRKLVRQARGEQ